MKERRAKMTSSKDNTLPAGAEHFNEALTLSSEFVCDEILLILLCSEHFVKNMVEDDNEVGVKKKKKSYVTTGWLALMWKTRSPCGK